MESIYNGTDTGLVKETIIKFDEDIAEHTEAIGIHFWMDSMRLLHGMAVVDCLVSLIL